MKKQDIIFEVAELIEIRDLLQRAESKENIDILVIRLNGNMNDLLSEAEFADDAEKILEIIDEYGCKRATRDDILKELNTLIVIMQKTQTNADRAEELKEMCGEVKTVFCDVVGVIRHQTKVASKEINEAIKKEMPACSNAIVELKKVPRKMEKKVKHGIKKWLNESNEE